ncbi:MAG: hypothetical protein LBS58_00385 [Coriobacteriales bacterium]|jgi:hypothetical protein|nr:hypothetical protein [Coriobacteriales bacterium]
MNPVIIIPTYVGGKRKTPSYQVATTYDHVTPLTHQGELARCLTSLVDSGVTTPVILLVVAEPGVEREATQKVGDIASGFADALSITLIDGHTLKLFYQRTEELGLSPLVRDGISLTGYGALRNFGLVVAAVQGYTEVVFIDDDEVVADPAFMETALYGLGKLTQKGIPILVKTGFHTNRKGDWKSSQKTAWYNRFWNQGALFNEWISAAMKGPRLSSSNSLYGGLVAIHREAFRRVSFDPWIPRGEDLDYLINLHMYGGGVWFDNQWTIIHLPPAERSEAQRFRQDIYRWIYEHRKLEYSRSQIDLLQIQPQTLDPYPGPFLGRSISRKVFLTALLRMVGRPRDREGYFLAAMAAQREAKAYAETFCARYFEFQLGWPQVMAAFENDLELRTLFGVPTLVTPVTLGEADEANRAEEPLLAQQATEDASQTPQPSEDTLLDYDLDHWALEE